jgi:K+-transporting ATPase KdpF subunit
MEILGDDGFDFSYCDHFILRPHRRAARIVQAVDGRRGMNVVYLVVGLVALALLAYLFTALLKPELFG